MGILDVDFNRWCMPMSIHDILDNTLISHNTTKIALAYQDMDRGPPRQFSGTWHHQNIGSGFFGSYVVLDGVSLPSIFMGPLHYVLDLELKPKSACVYLCGSKWSVGDMNAIMVKQGCGLLL